MSKQNLEKAFRQELEVLNDIIDQKIIKGLSYVREARRHKFLLSSIARLRRVSGTQSGWFSKSFSLVSTFIF
ncbi:TPA: hypothetical protein DCQ44_03085 [Candidatus Taylorbacteria bacterium]|nr:hypothetical protein [Candidatus Taylorbacteria bacterium]